jgi:hypothetical protein
MSENAKPPAEHIITIDRALEGIQTDYDMILDYSNLLAVLLSSEDAESALEGAHRIVIEIKASASSIAHLHAHAVQALMLLKA